jgi:hypothetical protein
MTDKQDHSLDERVKKALALDDERTQGEWATEKYNRDPIRSSYNPVDLLMGIARIRIGDSFKADADAEFIAAAPSFIDLIRDLHAALKAAEADRKDALRYQYLKPLLLAVDFDYRDEGISALVFEWPTDCGVSANLDATIDSAMEQTK